LNAAEDTGIPAITPAIGQRLHITGLLVGFIGGLPRLFFPLAAMLFGARNSGRADIVIPAIAAAVLVLSFLFRWASWTRFRYFIEPEDIRIESGLLSRNARSIPYERIQDVSIEQKPLARIFGLGEVKFETGGGKGDEGILSYVSLEEAERLRELVRDRKSDIVAPDDIAVTAHNTAEAEPLFKMDGKRLLTFGFYSFSLVIFAVLGGLAQQFDFLLDFDIWDIGAWLGIIEHNGVSLEKISLSARVIGAATALFGLIAVGVLTGIVRTVIREYGFRLDQTAKGFRRRRGLLTLTDVVMPAHRIQAATISTGPIRKRRGWHALKFISLADDGGKRNEDGGDHVAAPFATITEIQIIANEAGVRLPPQGMVFSKSKAIYWLDQWLILAILLAAAITAVMLLTDAGLYALWIAAIAMIYAVILYADWRNSGYTSDDGQLFVRAGWWQQKLTIVPQIKVQTIDISQGPLTRLRGLAKLTLGIAGGTLHITAIPIADAYMVQRAIIDKVAKVDYSDVSGMGN
jgi:putative membrane protein